MSRMWKVRLTLYVILAVLVGLVLLSPGCNTAQGVFEDSAWLLQKTADNIQTKD